MNPVNTSDTNRNKKSLGEVSPRQNNANYPTFNYIPLKRRRTRVRRRETLPHHPEFSKTPADILAPLVNGPIMQLWEVVEVQYQKMPCPYLDEFEARQQVDPESTCEKLLGVIRAFMDTSIVECVGEEKAYSYWKHVQRIADNDPKKLSSDFTGTFVSLRRSSVPVAVPVSPSKITV